MSGHVLPGCACAAGSACWQSPSAKSHVMGKGHAASSHRLAKYTYSFNQNLIRNVIEAIVVCPAGVGLM